MAKRQGLQFAELVYSLNTQDSVRVHVQDFKVWTSYVFYFRDLIVGQIKLSEQSKLREVINLGQSIVAQIQFLHVFAHSNELTDLFNVSLFDAEFVDLHNVACACYLVYHWSCHDQGCFVHRPFFFFL